MKRHAGNGDYLDRKKAQLRRDLEHLTGSPRRSLIRMLQARPDVREVCEFEEGEFERVVEQEGLPAEHTRH